MHIGHRIKEVLTEQGRTTRWLATQIHCDRRNVYYIFEKPSIDTATLMKISQILNHDFFADFSKQIKEWGVNSSSQNLHCESAQLL